MAQTFDRLRQLVAGSAGALLLAAGLLGGSARAQAQTFTLESPDLKSGVFDNKHVLNGFGCNGQNVSPALEWRNVPAGTKSLALQV
ncbi:MAG TPA: hypothetical protein VNU48_04450, partial [Burkholderiaceae bacterium]|nr:hypothetical protein [Burkholderiaceae bacterium]